MENVFCRALRLKWMNVGAQCSLPFLKDLARYQSIAFCLFYPDPELFGSKFTIVHLKREFAGWAFDFPLAPFIDLKGYSSIAPVHVRAITLSKDFPICSEKSVPVTTQQDRRLSTNTEAIQHHFRCCDLGKTGKCLTTLWGCHVYDGLPPPNQ